MKLYLSLPAVCLVAAYCACDMPYSSDFNRIENTKLRVIGVSYLPTPDVAPGDTVTARAYFAGNKVVRVDKFAMAFDAFGDEAGVDFVETPLPVISTQSWLPDSFQYTFVIPDSAIVKEYRRYSGITGTTDSIACLLLQPKDSVVSYIAGLPEEEQSNKMEMIKNTILWSNTIMSAYSESGASIRVVSSFAVRYHSRFPEYLSVNHNPSVSWVALYRVPRLNAMGFAPFDTEPGTGVYKQYLFNAVHPDSVDTQVLIDTGYSYFVACDNGIREKDSSGTMFRDTLWDTELNGDGELQREAYAYTWFYQNGEMASNTMDSLLVIDDYSSGPLAEVKPPCSTGMRHFKIWVAVTDRYGGSFRYRPRGMASKGVSGEFIYSDAYRKSYPYKP